MTTTTQCPTCEELRKERKEIKSALIVEYDLIKQELMERRAQVVSLEAENSRIYDEFKGMSDVVRTLVWALKYYGSSNNWLRNAKIEQFRMINLADCTKSKRGSLIGGARARKALKETLDERIRLGLLRLRSRELVSNASLFE